MLTLITVNYNNALGLSRTLKSVIDQCLDEVLEHIIIDGGSTDESSEILENYYKNNPNVRFVSEADNGIYDAMNKGIELATQDYVCFLNSGDILNDESCLQRVCSKIKQDVTIDVLYGDLVFFNETGRITRNWISGNFSSWKLFLGWMPPHPMTIIKRKVLIASNGFSTKFQIAADYDLLLRILWRQARKVSYMPGVLVRMEKGGISNSSMAAIIYSNFEVIKSWNNLTGIFSPYWIFVTKPLMKIMQIRR